MNMIKEKNVVAAIEKPHGAPLNQRFDFTSYAQNRHFLDLLADLSKAQDYYPNVSFGKNYSNVSIDSEGLSLLRERRSSFIEDMQALAQVASK